jgi:hypothetical protein
VQAAVMEDFGEFGAHAAVGAAGYQDCAFGVRHGVQTRMSLGSDFSRTE